MRRRDVDRLFRALLPAATAAWAVYAAGCTDKSGSRDDHGRESLPSCPHGKWCAPPEVARKIAQPEQPDVEGCPKALQGRQEYVELAKDPAYEGISPDRPELSANLNEGATKMRREADQDICCYDWVLSCPGGRPFVGEDRQPVVATWRRGEAWCCDVLQIDVPPEVREVAAAAWLEDAATEHASVGSFARATLELLAVGAPPELIAGCQQASLDEIGHARVCAEIARACGAGAREPGPLPALAPRSVDLRRLAVDTFVEGCVGETMAALAVQRAAAACRSSALRDRLARIASEEAEHSALAWRIVRWAVDAGGSAVLEAVRDTAAELEACMSTVPAPAQSSQPRLAAVGRLDALALHESKRDAWHGIVRPLLDRMQKKERRPPRPDHFPAPPWSPGAASGLPS